MEGSALKAEDLDRVRYQAGPRPRGVGGFCFGVEGRVEPKPMGLFVAVLFFFCVLFSVFGFSLMGLLSGLLGFGGDLEK